MAAKKLPSVPLPRSWTKHVRTAMLHGISLAQYATVYTRSWAADSMNERIRIKAENDRVQQEILCPADALLHDQLVAAFASYRMLTAVSNPIFPELQGDPNACFSLGSGIWDDLEAGDWCAMKINVGRPWEKVFSAPRIVPGPTNPVRQTGYWRKGSLYRTWMLAGAAAMDREVTAESR